MSMLTRTKGYFVIICMLMCGFLVTFSWRLLSGVADTSMELKPSRAIREFVHKKSSLSMKSRSLGTSPIGNNGHEEKGGKNESRLNIGFTDDEVGNLIAKIRELGLSAKQAAERLDAWQKQANFHFNVSAIPPKVFQTTKSTVKVLKKLNYDSKPKDAQNIRSIILHGRSSQVYDHNKTKLSKMKKSKYESNSKYESGRKNIMNVIDNDVQNDGDRTDIHPSSRENTKDYIVMKSSHLKHGDLSIGRHISNSKQTQNMSETGDQLTRHVGDVDVDKTMVNNTTLRPDYCSTCFQFNFPIILNHEKLCKSSSGHSEPVHLLMFIASAPTNYNQRTLIRQTWGAKCRQSGAQLKCLFVVGRSPSNEANSRLQLENDHHQDILQIGFKDSYANLTYKTISSLKWASKYCYSAKYVMKTDDDMYVNTELIPIMLQAAPTRKFMGGACWGSSTPNRDMTSKWFVSIQSFHKPRFPPMCSGTGYIMSSDVVRAVIFSSRNIPFFHLEDVYVSLCLQKYPILPINILGFSNMFQDRDACHYKNAVMTSHQVPPGLLEEFWLTMNKCPNSNVAPSQLFIVMPYPET